jgi:NAD(P)-dependent dehydrogenase (short-subunit alcohol dehydrogenase family)/acyl carrier protein
MECEVRPAETQQTAAALSLLVEAQTRCLETIEPSVLYKQLADAGLDYGPSFRLLTEIWRRDGEALARVSAKVAAGFHSMSPHVLDSALHAIAAALPEELRSLYVPSGCGACIYSRAPKGSVRVHVALHDFSSQGETIQVDALLADETGSVVALLKDLRLRRLSPTTQLVKAAARWSERTYATAWFAQDKSIAAALVRPKSRWLVLMDEARKAEDIATRLETEGQEVVRVAPFAAQPQPQQGARYERAMPSEIRSVIQREMGAGRPAFAGIVDCTRIGSASTDCATAEQVIDCSLLPFSDLARALAYDRVSEPPRLYVLTRDSQPVLESDSLTGLSNAPLWGFAKAMPFEQQELRCTRIDIDGTPSSVAPLVQLLLRHPEEDQYAVRHGTVYWPRLVHADPTTTRHRTAIHEDALYLVTGGLGGLGPHVCSWLVRSGARHVLLLGRHAPTKETLARLDSLRTSGAHIETVEIDVADFKAMEKLVTGLPKDRPLRGVIHAAGVLRDGAFLDVTRAQLVDVLKPKVTGAWNLHELTRTLPSLDFFVLFSSAASVVGSPGQASYMAANAYLDALAHHRRRHGMPALAVNWGPFAGSGMSAGSGLAEGLRTTGVQLIEPDQGMDLLGSILQLPMPQITVLPFDPESVVYHYPNSLGMRFFERLLGSAFSQVTRASVAHKLSERPALQTGYVAPTNEIEGVIAAFWQRALGVDRVGIEDAFFELGGDSVFAHQLLGQIQRAYSVQLDPAEAFEEFTVKNLALMVERALLAYVTQLNDAQAAELVDTRIGSEHAFSAKDA